MYQVDDKQQEPIETIHLYVVPEEQLPPKDTRRGHGYAKAHVRAPAQR